MHRASKLLIMIVIISIIVVGGIYFMKEANESKLNELVPSSKEKKDEEKDKKSEEVKESSIAENVKEKLQKTHPKYEQLIDTYRRAVIEQWGQEKLDENELGPSHYTPQPLEKAYGYEVGDINKDGVPELLLGQYREDGSPEVNEIYTLINDQPTKLFASGIRTMIDVYNDGTISESYSSRRLGYYRITDQGEYELIDGYEIEMSDDPKYKRLVEPFEEMTEQDMKDLQQKYNQLGKVSHRFEPLNQVNSKEQESVKGILSDASIENIVKNNYAQIDPILLEDSIDESFNRYHTFDDGEKMWKDGVQPNSEFYQEVFHLLHPKLSGLVTKAGMESIINEKFSLYWQPPATISFFGPESSYKVISKEKGRFTVGQVKEIPPQDVGGSSYTIVYEIDYVKENNIWKFNGLKRHK